VPPGCSTGPATGSIAQRSRLGASTVEALAATLVLILGMALAVAVLGRSWPRSSRLGGYRLRGRDEPSAGDQERTGSGREDDDTHWKWQ
jgi:hypothetical protein